MNDLYVLRHGIAVDPSTPGYRDDERPLTPKGERRMRQIGRGLNSLQLGIDRIVTSPLPRARTTAEIVADALGLRARLEVSNVLQTGSDAAAVQRWLRERGERRLMIVGHNPTLSDLISLLVLGSTEPLICDLKKGGIAALARSAGSGHLFEITWIATPRLLRSIAEPENNDSE
jgi:phosphohistidine phosphatase